ncbi:hypothetical protein HNQ80_004303 [Anaerosolibacter carboniphilus]|uniref:Uncharacterized protein n=1 Tax=Anaerosolibacter carboniphilus TaxID=1417629 RepID=A0A841KXU0_9FIRM|nr:hypothetical protein [Anaerosolibacter carboniphilus]
MYTLLYEIIKEIAEDTNIEKATYALERIVKSNLSLNK